MVRIAVPDAHERGYVTLAGTPPNEDETRMGAPRDADLRIPDAEGRNLTVREDEDGRYVGCPTQYADAVREYFADEYGISYDDESDGEDIDALVEDGICPWCPEDDRYEGEHLGQHASSAHPDEWDSYQEGDE